jgi:hypothetical protein
LSVTSDLPCSLPRVPHQSPIASSSRAAPSTLAATFFWNASKACCAPGGNLVPSASNPCCSARCIRFSVVSELAIPTGRQGLSWPTPKGGGVLEGAASVLIKPSKVTSFVHEPVQALPVFTSVYPSSHRRQFPSAHRPRQLLQCLSAAPSSRRAHPAPAMPPATATAPSSIPCATIWVPALSHPHTKRTP